MRTDPRMTADELEVSVAALLGPYAPQVTGIAALSTVPSLLRELRLLTERRPEPAVVIGPGVRTGVPLLVDNPREVGGDRVMNTLAAHRLFDTACVVVDFGTSTNIDVVSAKGEFLGGALAPGIEISLEALATRAAALRSVELVRPRSVIGKNTVECLQSGVLYGFAGQVDGLVRRILAELGARAGRVTVLGTGGLAPLMAGESETITATVRARPDPARAAADLPAQRAVRELVPCARRHVAAAVTGCVRGMGGYCGRRAARDAVIAEVEIARSLRAVGGRRLAGEPISRAGRTPGPRTFPSRCGCAGRSGPRCTTRATTPTRSRSRGRTRLAEVRAAHPDLPPDTDDRRAGRRNRAGDLPAQHRQALLRHAAGGRRHPAAGHAQPGPGRRRRAGPLEGRRSTSATTSSFTERW